MNLFRRTTRTLPRVLPTLAVALVISMGVTTARAATLPAGFVESQVASGLRQPTSMAFAPDGRLFVCEQAGTVRVIKNGALLTEPFVRLTVSSVGERGVLGIAFDPNFATNRFVYIYYTATSPAIHNRLSRFTANGDVAVAGSETQLMNFPNLSASNHNGGELHFGNDGKLYIGVGENAVGSNSQTLNNVLGKILRINSDGSIPSDNPFFNSTTGNSRAIWALGLRNPFNFAFDRTNGAMFINDVGQNTWEEVNRGRAGANYGWPTTEGATSDSRFVSPLYTYNHSAGACSIVGSTFYRADTQQFPAEFAGRYFFGDFCAGWIRVLNPANAAVTTFATGISSLVDLQVSTDGSLFYLARGSGSASGVVFQVRFSQAPAISAHPQSQTVSQGQSVTFSVTAAGTPPLTYQWQRNDVNISGATGPSFTLNAAVGDNGATYRVIVRNSSGTATSNRATLTVRTAANPNPPTATITLPANGASYSGGDTIQFSGTASDPEDGTLGAAAFTWEVVFHHATHTHPFFGPASGTTSGSVTIPRQGETASDVFYRIHLRVTDSGGRITEVTRDILPRTVAITLASNPTGLQLTLDGQPVTTPFTFTGVVGITRSLGATSPQTLNGQSWNFQSWSDNGAITHNINTPATATAYTATFTTGGNPTRVTLEAESLARTSTGASTNVTAEGTASGGAWAVLLADSVGDFVEFTTPTVAAGSYQLLFRYKTNNIRGQHNVQVDGATVGGSIDQFATNQSYPEVSLGTVVFGSPGQHRIRLTVTGRRAASNDFRVTADRFTLVPVTAMALEAERLVRTSSGAATAVENEGGASAGSWVALNADSVADFVEFTTPIVPAGSYQLQFRYRAFSGRAQHIISVDGAQLGGMFDQYSAVTSYPEVTVGNVTFATSGTHVVRLTIRDRNPSSSSFKLSADAFTFVRQ